MAAVASIPDDNSLSSPFHLTGVFFKKNVLYCNQKIYLGQKHFDIYVVDIVYNITLFLNYDISTVYDPDRLSKKVCVCGGRLTLMLSEIFSQRQTSRCVHTCLHMDNNKQTHRLATVECAHIDKHIRDTWKNRQNHFTFFNRTENLSPQSNLTQVSPEWLYIGGFSSVHLHPITANNTGDLWGDTTCDAISCDINLWGWAEA